MFQRKTSKVGPFNFGSPFTTNPKDYFLLFSSYSSGELLLHTCISSVPFYVPAPACGSNGAEGRCDEQVAQCSSNLSCWGSAWALHGRSDGSFTYSPVNLCCGVLRHELGSNNRFPSLGYES